MHGMIVEATKILQRRRECQLASHGKAAGEAGELLAWFKKLDAILHDAVSRRSLSPFR
jgi:hypothetical protein